MKKKTCETCGKELKNNEVFTVNGKIECEECAYSRPCYICGKNLKPNEVHLIDGRILCKDCHINKLKNEETQRDNEEPLIINSRYNDSIMKYLLRDAPTEKNAKSMFKGGIVAGLISIAVIVLGVFLGTKSGMGFNIIELAGIVVFVGSVFCVFLSKKKRPDFNTLYKRYHDAYKHPVFGNPEEVQKIVDEIKNNYVYEDREIAFSSKYFIQRDYLTEIIKTDDIIGVTNIALDEHTGGYIHYLVIFDRYGNEVKIRYLKNPQKNINSAVGTLEKYCYNAKCVLNPKWNSKNIPVVVTEHTENFLKETERNKEIKNIFKKENKKHYEIDDLSYIQEMKHSKLGNWQQYDVLLAARGYGWEMILDWADYMAKEDVSGISKVSVAVMPGMPETECLNEYLQSGSFSDTEALKNEKGFFTIGGLSKELRAPVQIIWLNQTRALRFFTITDDEVLMTRYIETMIRRTFNTPDSMKLAKPVELGK